MNLQDMNDLIAENKRLRDIVDELVEALKECLKVNGYANAREMINAALAKLEEE